MKSAALFTVMLIMVFSCSKKQEEQHTPAAIVADSTAKKPTPGSDKDAHGCKASAGYTWSELRQECLRIFESGTRIDPVAVNEGDAVMPAFVIFKGNKAEVFIQAEKSPFILERKSDGEPFTKNDWQLISKKGYILKRGEKILFAVK